MKYFVFILSFFLFSSSINGQIIGKYGGIGIPDAFQFNADSTFKYEYEAFHYFQYSEGKWSIDKKKHLNLDSYKQDVLPITEIEESSCDTANNRNLFVQFITSGESNIEDFICEIIINDTIFDIDRNGVLFSSGKGVEDISKIKNLNELWENYFRCDSLNTLRLLKVNVPIKTIYFQFVYNPIHFTTTIFTNNIIVTKLFQPQNNAQQLSFKIVLTDSLFFYKVFSNEKLKIKKNKIEMYHSTNKKWETINKLPDDANIFIRKK